MTDCPDCFKDQRSINDIFKQAVIDAQIHANKEGKEVAVFQDGKGYSYRIINGVLPDCTRKIIKPVR